MAYGMLDHSLGLQQQQQQQDLEPLPEYTQPAFYPVDEYRDVSLKALLDLSDDCLFDHEEDNNMNNSTMLNPIPLNVACDHIDHNAVAASDATSQGCPNVHGKSNAADHGSTHRN
jgi:hypothetical protein